MKVLLRTLDLAGLNRASVVGLRSATFFPLETISEHVELLLKEAVWGPRPWTETVLTDKACSVPTMLVPETMQKYINGSRANFFEKAMWWRSGPGLVPRLRCLCEGLDALLAEIIGYMFTTRLSGSGGWIGL